MGKLELVRQARLNGNLDLSLQRIQTLQKQLVQEKGDYAQDDSGKRAEHQRQLSCEEAIIYKELAMTYLQQGKPMLYQDTIRLANEQFQRCAANKL